MRRVNLAVLDTHVFVWLNNGKKLDSKIVDQINNYANNHELYISSISLWEIANLCRLGKLKLDQKPSIWLKRAACMTGLNVENISLEIALTSVELPNNFHGDPADRIIVSTAMSLNAILFTRDSRILDLPSDYIKCVEV